MPLLDVPPAPPLTAPPATTLQVALPVAVTSLDVAYTVERVAVADALQAGPLPWV